MKLNNLKWLFPQNIDEAKTVQKEMAKNVILENKFKPSVITNIAGIDVSNTPFDPTHRIFGAVIVLSYPALSIKEVVSKEGKQTFPYISGLLGFREVPLLIEAYQQLSIKPDIIMVDGHGVSHPRELGIASHLGVLLDIPTIGVAKSILIGRPAETLPNEIGSVTPLIWMGKEIAKMVRTKKGCSPLVISSGHKVTLNTAVSCVMNCLKGYRLPEPTRLAHVYANTYRKNFSKRD